MSEGREEGEKGDGMGKKKGVRKLREEREGMMYKKNGERKERG